MRRRSPFSGALLGEVRDIRIATRAVLAWEATLGTEAQELPPHNLGTFGRRSGFGTYRVLESVQARAWDRARRRPDFDAIHARYVRQWRAEYDPERAQVDELQALRVEVARLRQEVAAR